MRIVAGDFPAGTYSVEDGSLSQSVSNQIEINTSTVESVQYLDTVQERGAGGDHALPADVGENAADITKTVARFIIYFRSGKVIHASGTLDEYDNVLRTSKLADAATKVAHRQK